MKMRSLFKTILSSVLLVMTCCIVQAQVDDDILENYWRYRDRYKQEFTKISVDGGGSLPIVGIVRREYQADGTLASHNDDWLGDYYEGGDVTVFLGHYLAVLATERELLRRQGQSISSTDNEIYYAINAVNRLDKVAESNLSGDFYLESESHKNGFLLRDDMTVDFMVDNFSDAGMGHMKFDNTPTRAFESYGDLSLESPYGGEENTPTTSTNEMSLDQLQGLMIGLRFLAEYLPDGVVVQPTSADAPVDLKQETQDIMVRLMNKAFDNYGNYVRPDENGNYQLVKRGAHTGPALRYMSRAVQDAVPGYVIPQGPVRIPIISLADLGQILSDAGEDISDLTTEEIVLAVLTNEVYGEEIGALAGVGGLVTAGLWILFDVPEPCSNGVVPRDFTVEFHNNTMNPYAYIAYNDANGPTYETFYLDDPALDIFLSGLNSPPTQANYVANYVPTYPAMSEWEIPKLDNDKYCVSMAYDSPPLIQNQARGVNYEYNYDEFYSEYLGQFDNRGLPIKIDLLEDNQDDILSFTLRKYLLGSEETWISVDVQETIEMPRNDLFTSDNVRIILENITLSGMDWEYGYYEDVANDSEFYIFPLMYKLLHDNGSSSGLGLSKEFYRDILNSAPACRTINGIQERPGPWSSHRPLEVPYYSFFGDSNYLLGANQNESSVESVTNYDILPPELWDWPKAGGGWAGPNRWILSRYAHTGKQFPEQRGEHSGLDYMLLHNLYHLIYEDELPPYVETMSCNCDGSSVTNRYPEIVFDNSEAAYVLESDISVGPRFADYVEKGITTQHLLSEDMVVRGNATVDVLANLTICTGVDLTVKSGSSLRVKEGANLYLKPGADLVLEDGAELIIEGGNNLESTMRVRLETGSSLVSTESSIVVAPYSEIFCDDNTTFSVVDGNVNFGNSVSFQMNDNSLFSIANSPVDLGDVYTTLTIGDNSAFTIDESTITLSGSSVPYGYSGITIGANANVTLSSTDFINPIWCPITIDDNSNVHLDDFTMTPAPTSGLVGTSAFSVGENSAVSMTNGVHLGNVVFTIGDNSEVITDNLDLHVESIDDHESSFAWGWNSDLYLNEGYSLTLTGESSEFILDGMLHLPPGDIFTFGTASTLTGHIRVPSNANGHTGPHIVPVVDTDTRIRLVGKDDEDVILIIEDDAWFSFARESSSIETKSMTFKDGRIVMGDTNSKINGGGVSYMGMTDVFVYKGDINVYYNNLFSSTHFHQTDLLANLIYGSSALNISLSNFYKGKIEVDGNNMVLASSNFEWGTQIELESTTRPTKIFNSTFTHSPVVSKLSSSVVDYQRNEFLDRESYLSHYESDFNMRCNDVHSDINASESVMNISTLLRAGYNTFSYEPLQYGETAQLYLSGQDGYMYAKDGFNTFELNGRSRVGVLSDDFGDDFLSQAAYDYYDVTNNYWKLYVDGSGPQTPGPNQGNYDVGPNSRFVNIGIPVQDLPFYDPIDNQESPCGKYDGAIVLKPNKGAAKMDGNNDWGLTKSNDLDSIVFPVLEGFFYNGFALDSAVVDAMGFMVLYNDSTGDDLMAIERFHEIFASSEEVIDESMDWVYDIVRHQMKTTLEHAFASGTLELTEEASSFDEHTQMYVDVLMFATDSAVHEHNYDHQFDLELDKAHLFKMIGRKEMAWQLYTNLDDCPIDSAEQSKLNEWIYDIETQLIAIQNGGDLLTSDSIALTVDTTAFSQPSPLVADEFYFGANIEGIDQVSYTNCNLVYWKSLHGEKNDDFTVFPNPFSGVFSILYLRESSETATFILYDAKGNTIDEVQLRGYEGIVQVNQSRLSRGAYTYSIRSTSGGLLQSGQLIKQ